MELNRISDIAAFVTVVNAGNYTAAARSLGLTRSAVGKSISRLEERLGVRLLNRTTRSQSLTDEGKIMYERCTQILQDLQAVDTTMQMRREKPTGVLKLTAPLSLGQRHILPLLESFLQQWPELTADISFTDRFVDLIEEGFDIAIRIGHFKTDARVLTRTIAKQTMVTCAAPEYLAKFGTPTTPQTLKQHATILFFSAERRRNWYFSHANGESIYEGPALLNLDSSEAIRVSALHGFGLVNLPYYLIADDLRAGRLISVLDDYRPEPEPIVLLYPSKKYLSPRIRLFIDLLTASWQAGPPWEKIKSLTH